MADAKGRKTRVLAVDDDASIRDFYEEALATLGFEVACAPSAKDAKEVLKRQRPDVILMDIMMEGQDGISFTKEIRSDPATSDIPVVVVSGLADAGTLNDAILFGAVDYLVKPIDLNALKFKIERALQSAERRKKGPQGS